MIAGPFPGLRPFDVQEARLFFGREDQLDELLARLARRHLVAVVGASGSGKSSLVRAGLIPALERGYLPSAGASWQIAVCRPGADPIGNLARALTERRTQVPRASQPSADALRTSLDATSLGLSDVAKTFAADGGDNLLVVVDQFEEIFRFRDLGDALADEHAAEFVALLLAATEATNAPIYIVLTMRSDYLGDCARFFGLPEALNDSQFLVPQMTRDQVKEAIEGPVNVFGARIKPRLVQRLLHDVEALSRGFERRVSSPREPDPLPLLQHTLMRVWDVSRADRERGAEIDLVHYNAPEVNTIWNALDLHAEEAYAELRGPDLRRVAERVLRRLTDRDQARRDVRRPTPIGELAAVGLGLERAATTEDIRKVRTVIDSFAAPGRSFLTVDAQGTVDVSHESLIRQWRRLSVWVDVEAESARIFTTLAASATAWANGRRRSLYRGPELSEARRWWKLERPTSEWAERYGGRVAVSSKFLALSELRRWAMWSLAVAAAVVLTMALWLVRENRQSAAQLARTEELLRNADDLRRQAEAAKAAGDHRLADTLSKAANQVQQSVMAQSTLSSADAGELDRLRRESAQWAADKKQMQAQIDTLQVQVNRLAAPPAATAGLPVPAGTTPITNSPSQNGGGDKPASTGEASTPPSRVIGAGDLTPPAANRPTSNTFVLTRPPRYTKNPGEAFRQGIHAADQGKWKEVADDMREAIKDGPASRSILISSGRPELYAPNSYLLLALRHLEHCDWAKELTALSDAEEKSSVLQKALQQTQKLCP